MLQYSNKTMKRPWALRIWDDKRYFDLWHLNHFLAGALISSAGILMGFTFEINLVVTISFAIAWEIFEMAKGIEETKFNRAFDVIFALTAFSIIYFMNLPAAELQSLFIICLALGLVVQFWGLYAFRVRGGNHHWSSKN